MPLTVYNFLIASASFIVVFVSFYQLGNYYLIAPSIYENVDIKKGILLQLFGGTHKDFTVAGRGKFR